jgi:tripartite-type tricarboxylate transporter receptor subunit TctC
MRMLARSVLLLATVLLPVSAHAQAWPAKPIRIILQSPPGGTSDLIARLLANPLQGTLGQPVVVESRPGSFGIPAGIAVANSGPEGYTYGLFGSSLASNETTQKNLPFDTLKDLTPVALVVKTPNMISVDPASPITSLQELIAAAKAKPGGLSYGTPGPGLTQHFTGEWLRYRAGIDMVHVPFKGAGPAMTAAMGGQIPVVVTVAGSAVSQIQGGKLRAIAVSGADRLPLFPNVPTVAEQGYKDFSIIEWFGLVGAAGIPAEAVRRMNAEVNRALRLPTVVERLQPLGFEMGAQTPEEFRAFVESEIRNLRTIIRTAKISTD